MVFPRPIAHAYAGLQAVVRDELESPLHPKNVEEVAWYFEQLRMLPTNHVRPTDDRFVRAAEAFERPRFYPLYRQWLKDGDRALAEVSSTAISDALASGAGRVECLVLPHRYWEHSRGSDKHWRFTCHPKRRSWWTRPDTCMGMHPAVARTSVSLRSGSGVAHQNSLGTLDVSCDCCSTPRT